MDKGPHVQLCFMGGYLLDISCEAWFIIREELKNNPTTLGGFITVEDIYGCECEFERRMFVGARSWTPESGQRYQELNMEEDGKGYFEDGEEGFNAS